MDIVFWINLGLTVAFAVAFVALCAKKSVIQVFPDGIVIKDFLYPSVIPNDSIKSIKLVDKMPKLLLKSNGYGGLRKYKGFFRIKDYRKRAVVYLENRFNAVCIEIQTTDALFFINLKDEERTRQLYEEIDSTVKLVNESKLVYLKTASQKRSVVVIVVLVFLFTLITLIPILFLV